MKTTMLLYWMGLVSMILLITACGKIAGSTTTASQALITASHAPTTFVNGDPESGRAIFNGEKKIYAFVPCSTCHYVTSHRYPRLGPDLSGVAKRAETRVLGMSVVDYLRQSIREPDAYVVEGFPNGTMNPGYDDRLTEQDVNDLIAYLLTL